MADPTQNQWKTLDRDLGRFGQIELATQFVAKPIVGIGIALVFLIMAGLFAALVFWQHPPFSIIVAAAIFGAYMALNIGANDVANNMGPAVAESAGALLAGGDVVSTISKGIIDPAGVAETEIFI